MEITVGEKTFNVKVVEAGTYITDNSKKALRAVLIEFFLEGTDAFDRYYELSLDAVQYGVLAEDVFWTSTVYVSAWEQLSISRSGNVSEEMVYRLVWGLREDEYQN